MDYGQPSSCNCGQRGCSSYSSEPEPTRAVKEVIPAWMQKMLDELGSIQSVSELQPVGSYSRSKPTVAGFADLDDRSKAALLHKAQSLDNLFHSEPQQKEEQMQPVTRMEVTNENFGEMYNEATRHGYKGTSEEFADALNKGEPILLTVEELDPARSAFDAYRALNGGPGKVDVGAFLKALGGLTGGIAEARGLGVAGPSGLIGGVGKPVEIPEVIRKTADPETLQNYISKTMIPTLTAEIIALSDKFEGIELLRNQRRLQERLNKLMMYSTKPERIIATAIHDEHELAIYKCHIAQQVVAGGLKPMKGQEMIQSAQAGLNERKVAVEANQLRQKKEQERKEILGRLQDQLALLSEDVTKMEINTAAMYLRKLADGIEPPKVVEPVTEKELITKGAEKVATLQKPLFNASGSPLANLTEAERQGIINSFAAAFGSRSVNIPTPEQLACIRTAPMWIDIADAAR